MSNGICYLIGAGPGDPGLLTLRGRELIGLADVVVYDYLCNPRILRWARPDAEKILAGKRSQDPALAQEETNALLVERTRRGLVVARLKGGDPCVFGRGGEEAGVLAAAGLRFEIVPGVTSATAVPACAGIPVTHRDHCSAFIVATGHTDPRKGAVTLDYPLLARFDGTRVILMGVGKLAEITANLIAAGASPELPAAAVRWGTLQRQTVVDGTLANLAERAAAARFGPPGVLVVGGVVRLRGVLRWFEDKPLFGRRIAVTRPVAEDDALARALENLGADVIEAPLVRIAPAGEPEAIEAAARRAREFDWIVFASANGARGFLEAFFRVASDVREMGGARLAAVGPAAAAVLERHHLRAELVPEKFTAAALAEAFTKAAVAGRRVLLARGNLGGTELEDALRQRGAWVETVEAYRTEPETGDPLGGRARLAEEGADWITFASGSAARQWFEQGIPCPPGWKAASIGPSTSAALRRHGCEPAAEADPHTPEGLAGAILAAESPR